jgi:hypothetical protein
MLTQTEMQKIVDQINQIFTQLDKRLKILEEAQKPVSRTKQSSK